MSDEKEVKLVVPKSLMVVLWVIAVGLILNFAKPIIHTEAANASVDTKVWEKLVTIENTTTNMYGALNQYFEYLDDSLEKLAGTQSFIHSAVGEMLYYARDSKNN